MKYGKLHNSRRYGNMYVVARGKVSYILQDNGVLYSVCTAQLGMSARANVYISLASLCDKAGKNLHNYT